MSDTTKYSFSTGPFELSSPGPGSVEAYDVASGRGPGACLSDAVQNEIYRGHIPNFWDAFLPQAEKLTGQSRVEDTAATAKAQQRAKEGTVVKPVLEGWNKFITRVNAGLDDDAKKELAALAVTVASSLSIDPSPSRRESGPGKDYIEKANSWLAAPDKLEGKVATALTAVGDFDLERDENGVPEVTSLARLIKAYVSTLL